jgi:hypothetical protein
MINTANIISYKYLMVSINHRGKTAVAIAGYDGKEEKIEIRRSL